MVVADLSGFSLIGLGLGRDHRHKGVEVGLLVWGRHNDGSREIG